MCSHHARITNEVTNEEHDVVLIDVRIALNL